MKSKVLIVDDDPSIVVGLKFLMEQDGYEVLVAYDGETALSLAISERPDLILLDIMLPVMDGFTVCETLRKTPESREIKIVFLTAKGNEEDIARGLILGGDAYLTKPYANQTIVTTVRDLLGGRHESP